MDGFISDDAYLVHLPLGYAIQISVFLHPPSKLLVGHHIFAARISSSVFLQLVFCIRHSLSRVIQLDPIILRYQLQ